MRNASKGPKRHMRRDTRLQASALPGPQRAPALCYANPPSVLPITTPRPAMLRPESTRMMAILEMKACRVKTASASFAVAVRLNGLRSSNLPAFLGHVGGGGLDAELLLLLRMLRRPPATRLRTLGPILGHASQTSVEITAYLAEVGPNIGRNRRKSDPR